MGEKSFHHCCTYYLSDKSNRDNHLFDPYISHLLRIERLIPLSNMFYTLHYKSIEWPKIVYFEFPCIDECRCRKVPHMLDSTILYFNHPFSRDSITNTIMQYIGHIVLDVYCGQSWLPMNQFWLWLYKLSLNQWPSALQLVLQHLFWTSCMGISSMYLILPCQCIFGLIYEQISP